jgi:hypothetical protein
MLERIDRVFVSKEWVELYPNNDLQSLASICYDHALLLLRIHNVFAYKKRFHFSTFWPKFPGYLETVEHSWHCPLNGANMFRRLDWLLRNTTRCLKSWSDKFIGDVIHRLEMARDRQTLAVHEESLRQKLKLKPFGLASLQHTIARQESRFLWPKEGDVPTRFFHCHANARHWWKHIHSLV